MRGLTFFDGPLNHPFRFMVNIACPAATPTYIKVANFPGLYRHSRSGRYYACKKLHGVRRERSLETCDRKIAERRLKEWVGNLAKVDAVTEKTTLDELIQRYFAVTASLSESSRATDRSVIRKFLAWRPHGRDCQVRQIRPSMLDEWLAHDLHMVIRVRQERAEQPSAVVKDGRNWQRSPESAARAGYDGYKRKKGSKVHVAVDTLGNRLALKVTPANAPERAQVGALAAQVQAATSQNGEPAYVDKGYTDKEPAAAATAIASNWKWSNWPTSSAVSCFYPGPG